VYETDALGYFTHAPLTPSPVLALNRVPQVSQTKISPVRVNPWDLHGGQILARTEITPSNLYAIVTMSPPAVCSLKRVFQFLSISLTGIETLSPFTCASIHFASTGPDGFAAGATVDVALGVGVGAGATVGVAIGVDVEAGATVLAGVGVMAGIDADVGLAHAASVNDRTTSSNKDETIIPPLPIDGIELNNLLFNIYCPSFFF
jgi:hypothetical protein